MKLYAPLSIIQEYTKVTKIGYGLYKVFVYDDRRRDCTVSYTNNSSAFDRIVNDMGISANSRCSGRYTLRQAYVAILSYQQILILNSNYYLYKR